MNVEIASLLVERIMELDKDVYIHTGRKVISDIVVDKYTYLYLQELISQSRDPEYIKEFEQNKHPTEMVICCPTGNRITIKEKEC